MVTATPPTSLDLVSRLNTVGVKTRLPDKLRSTAKIEVLEEALGILQKLSKESGQIVVLLGEIWRVEKNYSVYTTQIANKLSASRDPTIYGDPITEKDLRQQITGLLEGRYTVRYGRIRDEAA